MASRPRRLLIVARDFPPSGGAPSLRVTKLAKFLPEFGWQTDVVTVPANHAWTIDESLLAELPENVRVFRVPRLFSKSVRPESTVRHATRELNAGLVQRLIGGMVVPDRSLLWALPAARQVQRMLGDTDAVLTTAPPFSTHLIGLLASQAHIPWLADYRDNWTTNPDYRGRILRPINRLLERAVLRHASAVSAVTSTAANELEALEPSVKGRTIVAPNGFDPDDLPRPMPRGTRFILTYAGSMRATRDPGPLLRALNAQLHASSDFQRDLELHLVGQVPRSVAEASLRLLGAHRVTIHGFVPHRRALEIAARSAVLIAMSSVAEAGAAAMTSKVVEYLALRRPILFIAPAGPGAELVRSLGGGEVVDPNDEHALPAAILRLYDRWVRGHEEIADPADLKPFTRRETARTLAAALDVLVRRKQQNGAAARGRM